MKTITITTTVAFAMSITVALAESKQSTLEYIESLLADYDQYKPPPVNDGEPRSVGVTIRIKDIFDISEHDSSFDVRYMLGLQWKDSRIPPVLPEEDDGSNSTRDHQEPEVEEEKWRLLPVEVMKDRGQ